MRKPSLNWLSRTQFHGPRLILCLTEQEFRAINDHLKVPPERRVDWIGESQARTITLANKENGERAVIVCVSPTIHARPSLEIASIIVHESVHVWQATVKWIGEDNPGDEQEAYAIENIAYNLLSEYARRIKNKKFSSKAKRS